MRRAEANLWCPSGAHGTQNVGYDDAAAEVLIGEGAASQQPQQPLQLQQGQQAARHDGVFAAQPSAAAAVAAGAGSGGGGSCSCGMDIDAAGASAAALEEAEWSSAVWLQKLNLSDVI